MKAELPCGRYLLALICFLLGYCGTVLYGHTAVRSSFDIASASSNLATDPSKHGKEVITTATVPAQRLPTTKPPSETVTVGLAQGSYVPDSPGTVEQSFPSAASQTSVDIAGDAEQRPSAPTFPPSSTSTPIDVVMASGRSSCVLKKVVDGLREFLVPKPKRIFILLPPHLVQPCQQLHMSASVHCMNEQTIIPITPKRVTSWLAAKGQEWAQRVAHKRGSWYFQQFLKFFAAYALKDLSERFLVWEADMILVREHHLFLNGKIRILTGGFIGAYRFGAEGWFGFPIKKARLDTCVHHMFIDKKVMLEMLEHICGKGVTGQDCAETMIRKLPAKAKRRPLAEGECKTCYFLGAFAEYMTYHSWLMEKHRDLATYDTKTAWIRPRAKSSDPDVSCMRFDTELKKEALSKPNVHYVGLELFSDSNKR